MSSYQNLDSPSDAPAKNCCQESRPVYVFGFLTLAAGIAVIVIFVSYLPGYVQNMADSKVADKYVPKEGSSDFDNWLRNDDPGDPLEYKTFWFFNLSNAYDVIYNRSAPIVEEIGPFVYQMHIHKLAVDTSVPKEVSYIEWLRYSWVADPVSFIEADGSVTTYKSLDPDQTYITMFEPAILASLYQIEHNPWNISTVSLGQAFCGALKLSGLGCLNLLANLPSKITGPGSDALLSTRTANQWLGALPGTAQPSPFLDYLNSVLGKNSSYDHNWAYVYNDSKYTEAEALAEWKLQTVRFDRDDLSKPMSLLQWQGNRVLLNNHAAGSIAPLNFLNDGRLFSGWGSDIDFSAGWYLLPQYTHPNLAKEEPLDFWLSLGARSVRLVYNKTIEFQGVKGHRYEVDYAVFDNTTENFEMFGSTINGLVNVGPIQNYAPAFVTHPHFLDYPNILEQFDLKGVTPGNAKKHRTFADVDPVSGLVFNAAERLQVNILTPELDFAAANVPGDINMAAGNLLPVLWLEQRSQGTDDDIKDLKQLQSVSDIKRYLVIGGSLGGAVVLVIALLLLRRASNLSQLEQQERLARPTTVAVRYGTSESSRPLTAASEFSEGN